MSFYDISITRLIMSMIPYKLLQSRIILEYASKHRIGQLFKRCFARFFFATLKASKCRLFRPSEIGK